jgi:hypothetical protein
MEFPYGTLILSSWNHILKVLHYIITQCIKKYFLKLQCGLFLSARERSSIQSTFSYGVTTRNIMTFIQGLFQIWTTKNKYARK